MKMQRTKTMYMAVAFAVCGLVMLQACDTGGNQGKTAENDQIENDQGQASQQNQGWDQQKQQEFLSSAAQINMEEIKAGELAQEKAQDQQVQEYAETLKEHHQKNKQKLQDLAQQMNVQLPEDLSSQKQEKIQQLRTTEPGEFEEEFLSTMVKGHEEAVQKFEEAEKKVTNDELKSYISETLPTLRNHLEKAQSLQAK